MRQRPNHRSDLSIFRLVISARLKRCNSRRKEKTLSFCLFFSSDDVFVSYRQAISLVYVKYYFFKYFNRAWFLQNIIHLTRFVYFTNDQLVIVVLDF